MKTTFFNIYKFLSKNRVDLLYLLIIIFLSLFIRLFLINTLPVNITGDESWDISHVYRIVFGNDVAPMTFLGDGSVSAIVFYPVAFLISVFGTENSIFFLRLNIITYSLLSLIAFYFLLKKESSTIISLLFTLLLSSNYVFLNFSRTAWVNMMSVFSGLFMILYVEIASKEKKNIWYLIAGIFGGTSFYGYHFGRILVISIIAYLIFDLFLNRFNKQKIKGFIIFILSILLVTLPFLLKISLSDSQSILRRPNATFAFSHDDLSNSSSSIKDVFIHQLSYTLRGFIIFDESIMNEGIENSRYVPSDTSPVNIVIKILFILGLIFFALKKKMSIWWFVIASILFTQVISVLPPNFSRGIFYIPVVYFICGIFVYNLILKISSRLRINKNFIYGLIIISSLFIFIHDVKLYFSWMKESYVQNVRQPAISYEEFNDWQNYQINIIKSGGYPINNYEWYNLKNSLK